MNRVELQVMPQPTSRVEWACYGVMLLAGAGYLWYLSSASTPLSSPGAASHDIWPLVFLGTLLVGLFIVTRISTGRTVERLIFDSEGIDVVMKRGGIKRLSPADVRETGTTHSSADYFCVVSDLGKLLCVVPTGVQEELDLIIEHWQMPLEPTASA